MTVSRLAHAAALDAATASLSARDSMRGIRSLRYSAVPRTSSTGFANDANRSPARAAAAGTCRKTEFGQPPSDASGEGPQPPTATRTSPSRASDTATETMAKSPATRACLRYRPTPGFGLGISSADNDFARLQDCRVPIGEKLADRNAAPLRRSMRSRPWHRLRTAPVENRGLDRRGR